MSDKISPVDAHPPIAPAAPITRTVAPSVAPTPPASGVHAVPHPELVQAEMAPVPSPEAPHGLPGETAATMAGHLHDAMEAMPDANNIPEDVRRARAMRERAAGIVALGTPPLILDPHRGDDASEVKAEDGEDDGESPNKVDPMQRRKKSPNQSRNKPGRRDP